MALYEVQDPETGLVLELEGDSPPTEQELEQIFAQQNQQESLANEETSVLHNLNQFVRNAPGIGAALDTGRAIFGDEKVEGVQRAMAEGALLGFGDESEAVLEALFTDKTYKEARDIIRAKKDKFEEENPVTSAAANVAGGLATGAAGVGKAIGVTGAKTLGGKAVSGAFSGAGMGAVTGAGMSEAELTGEDKDIGGLLDDVETGTKFGAGFGLLGGGIAGYLGNKAAKNQELVRILETKPDARAAKYMMDGAGKIVKDKAAKEAIRQGFDEGVVAVVKGSKKADKTKMQKMLNLLVQGRRDPTKAIRNRPANVLGESISQRYKYVQNLNRKAGKDVRRAAEGLKGQSVDYMPVVDDFVQSLDDMGVTLQQQGKRMVADFSGSDFEKIPGAEKAINQIVNRMSDTKIPDAYDVHRLKKFIDNNVVYGKTGKAGGELQAERLLKGLRANLDNLLDGKFKAYDDANTIFAQTKNALGQVDELIGKASSSQSANFDKTLGTLARRISSNAMSGGRVDDAILELSRVADDMGGSFRDDFDTLVVFANELEKRFGSTSRTSFQGQIENVVDKGITRTVIDKATEKLFGVDEEKALTAIRRVLAGK